MHPIYWGKFSKWVTTAARKYTLWHIDSIQPKRLRDERIIHLFNLYPENWFEGDPGKSTLENLPGKSTQIFFRRAPWKKLGVILINQKKIRRAPWKNLGRFYRVDFTGYPSNQFSSEYRLNRQLSFCSFVLIRLSICYWQKKWFLLELAAR